MDFVTILGLIAGALTTTAFLPQLIKTWRSQSAQDVSLGMLIILGSGISLWLVYGFYTRALPVIAANLVTLLLVLAILALKIRFK